MAKFEQTAIDKLVGIFSPRAALGRVSARASMSLLTGGGGAAHSGASAIRRAFRSWGVTGGDANADNLPESETLRARTRDLYRNNLIARAAIRTVRTNVVGSGLRLNAQIDREFLGLTDEQAEDWERTVEREFCLWAESQFADATLTGNFYELQALVFLSTLQSGDCFALLPWVRHKGCPYDLRVQLVEADRVCNKNFGMDTDACAGGIEVDGYGAPTRYWFCTPHPGAVSVKPRVWQGIPAFGTRTARRNVLHLFDRERPEQRRGLPYLAPVIEPLKQLGRYTEAELMAAVVSGMFTVFIETENGDGLDGAGLDTLDAGAAGVPGGQDEYKLGAGAIIGLAPGEKANAPNPGRPNTAFDPFVQAIIRQIGAGLEIPFELLMKHFSASYSASKAALLEAWKFFRHRRDWLVHSFCAPVYAEWLTEAIIKGRVNAPGFLEDHAVRAAYLGAEWVGPTMGQIDPLKEVQAAKMRIDETLTTRSREAAELTGADFERVAARRGREEKMRKQYDLQPPELPGAAPTGAARAKKTEGGADDEPAD